MQVLTPRHLQFEDFTKGISRVREAGWRPRGKGKKLWLYQVEASKKVSLDVGFEGRKVAFQIG